MSRTEIIRAAGRNWAIGLVWRSFSGRPSRAECRQDAQALGADWMMLNETIELTQVGFCTAIAGEKVGKIYAMSAAIAEEYRQPWSGIFQINDNLWWYIAVRDGQAILPDGDVAGDYETVLKARESHASHGDWTIHDGTLEDLLPVLEIAKKTHNQRALKAVKSPPLWRALVPLAVVVIVAIGGFWFYREYQHSLQMAQERRLLAIRYARSQMQSMLAVTPAPDTWLAACAAHIKPLTLSRDGWIADRVTCINEAVIIVWERRAGASISTRPAGDLSKDGNQVVERQPLGRLPPGRNKPLRYLAEDEALYALLQPIGVQATIGNPVREPNSDTVKQLVNFTLPISPFEVDFNKVPGLRLSTLSWGQSGWAMSGAIYAK